MNEKKEQFFMVLKACICFFAAAMVAAYIYCLFVDKTVIGTVFIGQVLLIDGFLFVGGILGVSDIVLPIRSTKIRVTVVGAVLYGISLYLMSFASFNPLGDIMKLLVYTFMFILYFILSVIIFSAWQKILSKKYMHYINRFRQEHENE